MADARDRRSWGSHGNGALSRRIEDLLGELDRFWIRDVFGVYLRRPGLGRDPLPGDRMPLTEPKPVRQSLRDA